jgi:outer membrane receptor protein involved in Fe transport
MKKILLSFTLLLLATASTLLAQTQDATSTLQDSTSTLADKNLNEVTVVSSRLVLKSSQLPQKLNVVTERDFALTTGFDIADIVKKNTSIDVIQYPQALSYVSIRGFRPPAFAGLLSPESSILMNGRQSGTYNLALIDPNSIERIEVLKGAAASMYGSSAMGGIINIITKQSKGKPTGHIYGGYGSFQTTELGFSAGGNLSSRVDFNLSGTFYDRNANIRFGGGNLFRRMLGGEEVTLTLADGTMVKETDRRADGEERNNSRMGFYSGMARVGIQLAPKWRIDLTGENYIARNIETSGDLAYGDAQRGISNRYRSSGELAVSGEAGKHTLAFKAFASTEDSNLQSIVRGSNQNTIPTPTFQSSQTTVNWEGFQLQDVVLATNNLRLTLGLDYTKASSKGRRWNQGTAEQGFPITEGRPSSPWSSITSWAPFGQVHWMLLNQKLIINPSFRYDFLQFNIIETPNFSGLQLREERNTFASPAMALQYALKDNLFIHSNIGRAFRFPRPFEISGYLEEYIGNQIRIQKGNPNLKNEESLTFDLGIRLEDLQKGFRLDLTYFSTNVRNRVRQVDVPAEVGKTFTSPLDNNTYTINRFQTFINANRSEIRGLEIEAGYDFGAKSKWRYSFRIFGNATHFFTAEDIVRSLDGSQPDTRARIRNVAPTTTTFGIEYDNLKNFQIRLSGRSAGKRLDNDFGNLILERRGALIEYAPYMTLDLVASYTFEKQHTLSLRINNLTDENYYEKRGYNMPGRMISARYTFHF